jgi:hypothetical protein
MAQKPLQKRAKMSVGGTTVDHVDNSTADEPLNHDKGFRKRLEALEEGQVVMAHGIERNTQKLNSLDTLVLGYSYWKDEAKKTKHDALECFIDLLTVQMGIKDTKRIEKIADELSECYLIPPQQNGVSPLFVTFTKKMSKDFVWSHVKALKGKKPHDQPLKLRQNLSTQQNKHSKACKKVFEDLKAKHPGKTFLMHQDKKLGFHIKYDNRRLAYDSKEINELLGVAETKVAEAQKENAVTPQTTEVPIQPNTSANNESME